MQGPAVCASAQARKIGIVFDVGDIATVERSGDAAARALRVTEDVLAGDTITTGSESHVRVGFSGGALIQLGGDSAMSLTDEAGRPLVNLQKGRVYYRVSRDDLRDEADAVLTPNAVARTRAEVSVKLERAADSELATTVCMLRGHGSAATRTGVKVGLAERECITIHGSVPGTIFQLPPQAPSPPPLGSPVASETPFRATPHDRLPH